MRLTILGGGGFRVPLVHRALLSDRGNQAISQLTLFDTDAERLNVIAEVLRQQAAGCPTPPSVRVTSDLRHALRGADFVFSAIRVGGLAGRIIDERVALDLGVLGQETVGAGGIAYGLRTVPVAMQIAQAIAEEAPEAWLINFTNPAGLVTEAMQRVLGARVIGICDSPAALVARTLAALRTSSVMGSTDIVVPGTSETGLVASGTPETGLVAPGTPETGVVVDYVGLNHLGWLRGISIGGVDRLPSLLADPQALDGIEEGRLFGAEWLRALGSIPNEYLHYYYFARETRSAIAAGTATRGEFLDEQQTAFYGRARTLIAVDQAADAHDSRTVLDLWHRARAERDATYLAESREIAGAGPRSERDLQAGGYEDIALSVMRAIALDEPAELIVNVANRGALGPLDDDAVIEIGCRVDGNGAVVARATPQLTAHQAGLMCSVKAVDRSIIEAATTGSREAALRAFAQHPLVDSVNVAAELLDAYVARHAELSYLRA